ncbi:MAG: hypothetical protein ACXVUE_17530 [Solirubrobacteraceae bacterium]
MARRSCYSNGREAFASDQSRFMRELCRDAARQPTSLKLEQWASMLLGSFWERRDLANSYGAADPVAAVGEPFLTAIARVGNRNAKVALLALARIDRGALGPRARDLADELAWSVPRRVEEVGTARLVEALVASSPGDGEAILLRSDAVGPLGHVLAVYIDEWHRRIAKHVALIRPDALAEVTGGELRFRPADLATTCRKVAKAIKRTDVAADPPVNESFSQCRAIALARLSPLER